MSREIHPKDTTRNMAYELWMKAPNPMVTFFKTLDGLHFFVVFFNPTFRDFTIFTGEIDILIPFLQSNKEI